MRTRFQFSLSQLLYASVLAAIVCGLTRFAFEYSGNKAWLPPALIILAASSTGAAVGIFLKRPLAGAVVGCSLATAYLLAVVAFALTYGVG